MNNKNKTQKWILQSFDPYMQSRNKKLSSKLYSVDPLVKLHLLQLPTLGIGSLRGFIGYPRGFMQLI